jgi:putative protein-disulfide isomerase
MMSTFEASEMQDSQVERMNEAETLEAFRQDLRDTAYFGIGRFPTLVLHRTDGRGIVLVGYRPSSVLCEALDYLVPGLYQKPELAVSQEDFTLAYVTRWQHLTARELAEILNGNMEQTSVLLEALVARGALAHSSRSETPIYVPFCMRK